MTKNLIAKNGTVTHAPIGEGYNVPDCAPKMARNNHAGFAIPTGFAFIDGPVTCKACCAKQGVEAPTAGRRRAAGKAPRVARTVTQADLEASRAAMVERAEFEVTFEGGTVMDQLHAMAATVDGFRKGRR